MKIIRILGNVIIILLFNYILISYNQAILLTPKNVNAWHNKGV